MLRNNTVSWFLKRAIKKGDLDRVKKLTAKHPEEIYLNARDKNCNTPLLLAAKNKNYEIMRHLLSLPKVDVSVVNQDNQTVLSFMPEYLTNSNVKICGEVFTQVLEDERLSLAASHPSLQHALRICISHHFNKAARLLIDTFNVDINCHALSAAARRGNIEILEILLSHKNIDVMQKDANSDDALSRAIQYYENRDLQLRMTNLLLSDSRTNVNTRYRREISNVGSILAAIELAQYMDHTPESNLTKLMLSHPKLDEKWFSELNNRVLFWAHKSLPTSLYKRLLSLPGIEVSVTNRWGYEYGGWVVKVNENQVLNFLANDVEFPVNMQLWDGSIALTRAIRDNDQDRVNSILQRNDTNIHTQQASGDTALLLAEEMGNSNLVNKLLTQVNFGLIYANMRNIVMLAAANGQTSLVRKLLKLAPNDFDINAQDDHGDTALTLAVKHHNKPDLIETLTNAGANAYVRNNSGWDALMIASDKQFLGLYELMSRSKQEIATAPPAVVSSLGLYASTKKTPPSSMEEYYVPPKP